MVPPSAVPRPWRRGREAAVGSLGADDRGCAGGPPGMPVAMAHGLDARGSPMLLRHRGREPTVDPSAFVAPTATLVGDVRAGPRARVMYGAVLDAEGSRVEVGECADRVRARGAARERGRRDAAAGGARRPRLRWAARHPAGLPRGPLRVPG